MISKIIISFGFALALVGMLTIEATAQSSCSGWYSTCRARCGKTSCPRCEQKIRNCTTTGCWLEDPQYGGKNHCNLQKK